MNAWPFASAKSRSLRLVAVFALIATSLVAQAPASALLTFGLEVIVDGDGPGTVTPEVRG